MIVKCPVCDQEWQCDTPGKYQCECGALFLADETGRVAIAPPDEGTPVSAESGNDASANTGDEDVFDKTIPPRRREEYDSAADVTIPGRRERKPDGRFVPGDLIMGRYEVLSELGQGGMGVVYKCFDRTGGIEVALKALPPELSHNTLEMEDIRDNFQLVAKLVHQNIAISRNLERDNSNGNYYLIMECVEGEDLRRWIKRKRREPGGLTLADVLPVVTQVAAALDYAHKEGVIHRDIKPGNIMIDKAGDVKVLDFGLAAQIHTSMTRVSMAYHGTSGTGPYMAPEQWRGRAQGAAADQYALAVMTYEMLAWHLPFESTDAAVLREAVLNDTPEPIVSLPQSAQKALARALSKDPAERFDSCAGFVTALDGVAVKEPVGKRSVAAFSPQEDTPLLIRARLFLKDGDFASAKAYCERALDVNPKNADAYFCRLLAELQLRDESELTKSSGLGNNRTFKLARQFADEQLGIRLDDILRISETNEREEEKRRAKVKKRIITVVILLSFIITVGIVVIKFVNPAVREYLRDQEERRRAEERLKILSSGDIVLALPGGVKLALVKVEAGSFEMCADNTGCGEAEVPHHATLTKDFYIGKTEVTEAQWQAVMDNDPLLYFKGDDLPVAVSWYTAMKFCEKLNEMGKAPSGYKFTLPTETQWEYAARGGRKSCGYRYSGSNDFDEVAWRHTKYNYNIHPVATKKANELGLYDMSGNVYEWCLDDHSGYSNKAMPEFSRSADDSSRSHRVVRGGNWIYPLEYILYHDRRGESPYDSGRDVGFRLALAPISYK